MFERLPAWVTARASELAPLAVLAPHATLRRLVTDGLWHTTQVGQSNCLSRMACFLTLESAMMSFVHAKTLAVHLGFRLLSVWASDAISWTSTRNRPLCAGQ